jgi:heat shock protein HtpX
VAGSERAFRVSVRVQCAGVISLILVPAIVAGLAVLLFLVNVALGLIVCLLFAVAAQAAVARRWTSARPKPLSPGEAAELEALVARLCVQAGMTQPRIFLHSFPYANSWVKGLSSRRSTLHLTAALVETLNESELEGAVAHELAHIGSRDSILMSVVGAARRVDALGSGAVLPRDRELPALAGTEALASLR